MTNPLNLGNSICKEDIGMIFDDNKYELWKHTRYTMKDSLAEKFEAVTNKPKIVIVGDYDVDGIMGSYLTVKLMKHLHPNSEISYIVPKRFTDGYGISKNIVDAIIQEYIPNETCIVTVDNGISQFDSLNTLYNSGYTIALTDHHEALVDEYGNYRLPLCDCLVNPHVKFNGKSEFTFEHYCGAGVIYQLAKSLLSDKELVRKEFLPYAAIATIADVVPLVQDNWIIVREILDDLSLFPAELNFTKKPKEYLNESDIGFLIAPTLNASGRLLDDGATKVLDYLFQPTGALAKELCELNEQRKKMAKEQTEMAFRYIKEYGLEKKEPIMVNIPGLHHGIIGLVAGQVSETYKRACLICSDGKGSGRSPNEFDIFQFGFEHLDLFRKFGGHPGACGFSITDENFEKLTIFAKDREIPITKSYDIRLEKDQISEFYNKTKKYRPFGCKNPAPRCMVSVRPNDDIIYNKNGEPQHLFVINKDGSKIARFNHINPITKTSGLIDNNAFDGIGEVDTSYLMDKLTTQLNIREVYDPEEPPLSFRR